MTQYKLILGSSVRTKEWDVLQKRNASLFDNSIILTDGFESDFYNYLRTKENYFMASTCRNLVIEEFLKTDGTHLVWLDEDCKLDKENYNKLLKTIEENPNDIILGERTYKSGMKDIRVKNNKFHDYVTYNYAYTCFIVWSREVFETQEDFFPDSFNGSWGFEDLAFAFKCKSLGFEFFVSNAKTEMQGFETNVDYEYDNQIRLEDECKQRQHRHNSKKFKGYKKFIARQMRENKL